MNITEIEQLVELVSGANIGELTLRHEGTRITIRKAPRPSKRESTALAYLDATLEDEEDFQLDMTESGESGEGEPEENIVMVKSPRVGAFRHAKSPVVLGASVREGQVLGIVEAMKLPSDVVAPIAGKVVEVFVEEGQFVEYGQDLYAIENSPAS